MKTSFILFIFSIFMLISCGKNPSPEILPQPLPIEPIICPEFSPEQTSLYTRKLTIEGLCQNGEQISNSDYLINCTQTLSILSNQEAVLMLTDIPNFGHYEIHQDLLIFTANQYTEVDKIIFRIDEDENLIDESGNIWRNKIINEDTNDE